ncbi:MAG: hypothetical protein R2881_05110 [Eubacteriales bacterium]
MRRASMVIATPFAEKDGVLLQPQDHRHARLGSASPSAARRAPSTGSFGILDWGRGVWTIPTRGTGARARALRAGT